MNSTEQQLSDQLPTQNRSHQVEQPLLSIDSLDVAYETKRGTVNALRDVSLELFEGEILGVAGESGSGKSTLAYAILQYLGENGRVNAGSIEFRGDSILDLTGAELREIRGNNIAHVAQDPNKALNPSVPVGEQIAETIRLHEDVTKQESMERTYDLLDQVDIPEPEFNSKKFPNELSGGMQQRILIAMALSCNPDLLILDEPTTGLDVTTQSKILNLVNELKTEFDTSFLLITHNLGVIAETTDRVAILYAGKMMEVGPTEDVFSSPTNPYTQGLLATIPEIDTKKGLRPIPGRIPDLVDLPEGCIFADRCEFVEDKCRAAPIEMETVDTERGHRTRCRRWKTAQENPIRPEEEWTGSSSHGDTLLKMEELKKHFSSESLLDRFFGKTPPVKAVDGVSFGIRESETIALVGESGCGKSTLGRTLLHLYEPTTGDVFFRGEPVSSLSKQEMDEFRSSCQIIFQNPDASLNPRKTIRQVLERPLKRLTDLDAAEREGRIVELLEQIQLGEGFMSRYPHELSGGEKQRIAIARAYATNPSLIVLDEPVSSLDVSVQANILNLLVDLQSQYGTSYIFITHDLSVARQIADRVLVMYLGGIVESGPIEDIFKQPEHPYTQTLRKGVPRLDVGARGTERAVLTGDVPSARDTPSGCRFHTRCPEAREACRNQVPPDIEVNQDHQASCFRLIDESDYWDSDPLDQTQ